MQIIHCSIITNRIPSTIQVTITINSTNNCFNFSPLPTNVAIQGLTNMHCIYNIYIVFRLVIRWWAIKSHRPKTEYSRIPTIPCVVVFERLFQQMLWLQWKMMIAIYRVMLLIRIDVYKILAMTSNHAIGLELKASWFRRMMLWSTLFFINVIPNKCMDLQVRMRYLMIVISLPDC